MLSRGIVFIHNNARPHTTNVKQQLFVDFDEGGGGSPLYSPDLASVDFHLFLQMKSLLGGQNFNEDDKVKEVV